MTETSQRLYYIDWLRVISILLIFFFHADRFFDAYDWHVKNPDTNLISTLHISFLSLWIMPLFFVLSGAAIFLSLKIRPGPAFLRERVTRIFFPLVTVGYFITSPPQMYFERLTHNKFSGSFPEFIPKYFQGVDMFGGNFPWHGFHLWYLVYLFVFSILLFPLFKARKNNTPSLLSVLSTKLESPERLLLLIIPVFIVNVFIDVNALGFMRGTGGWDLFSYLFFLIYGYLFFSNEKIPATIQNIWKICFVLAITLSVTRLFIHFGIKPEISEDTPVLYLCLMFMRCFNALLWTGALIGLGKCYLNFTNRFLRYANEAVLPFYILHQFVLMITGYVVVQWNIPVLIKFIVISGVSFTVIMGLYHPLIRRFNFLRVFFGLKRNRN